MEIIMGLFDSIKNSLKNSVNSSLNNTAYSAKSSLNKAVSNAADSAVKKVTSSVKNKSKSFKFTAIPTTLDELKALPEAKLDDYFATAALTVLALNVCATDRATGLQMLDFLNGPNAMTGQDEQFINTQFMDGKSYIPRSYFKGATPENNYTPATPYEIEVIENPYSKDNFAQGYITLYVTCYGADSPRNIGLRTKKSTGEWFVNDYRGLLAGIRIPKDQDAWA